MAVIAIKYGELRNAAKDSEKVSKKLTAYADSINKTVLDKLNRYRGDRTGNISSSMSNARSKKGQLEEDSRRYKRYSDDLKRLEEDCKKTDNRVADRIKGITGTFKNTYGIKTNTILDAIGRFFTGLGNSNRVFRWIGNNVIDKAREGRNYLKSCIKEWFHYGGGKQLIKGSLIAILEIAAAVIGVVLVFLGTITGVGAAIVAIAAVIGGVIALASGVTNLRNEIVGYQARKNGDPSFGYRLSKLDTYTDTLRTFSDDKRIHLFANVLDGVEFVCNVIGFLDGAKDLLKNGYKWASGNLNPLEKIKLKDILTKSNFKDFGTKLKTSLLDGLSSVKSAFARGDLEFFKGVAKNFSTDFIKSFKDRFMDFGGIEKSLKSFKNIASFGKGMLEADSIFGVMGTIGTEIILPCTNIASTNTAKTDDNGNFIRVNNRIVLEDPESISLDDLKGFGEDMFKLPFSDFPDLFGKFSEGGGVSISIPEIYVPRVEIQMNLNLNIRPIPVSSGIAA